MPASAKDMRGRSPICAPDHGSTTSQGLGNGGKSLLMKSVIGVAGAILRYCNLFHQTSRLSVYLEKGKSRGLSKMKVDFPLVTGSNSNKHQRLLFGISAAGLRRASFRLRLPEVRKTTLFWDRLRRKRHRRYTLPGLGNIHKHAFRILFVNLLENRNLGGPALVQRPSRSFSSR